VIGEYIAPLAYIWSQKEIADALNRDGIKTLRPSSPEGLDYPPWNAGTVSTFISRHGDRYGVVKPRYWTNHAKDVILYEVWKYITRKKQAGFEGPFPGGVISEFSPIKILQHLQTMELDRLLAGRTDVKHYKPGHKAVYLNKEYILRPRGHMGLDLYDPQTVIERPPPEIYDAVLSYAASLRPSSIRLSLEESRSRIAGAIRNATSADEFSDNVRDLLKNSGIRSVEIDLLCPRSIIAFDVHQQKAFCIMVKPEAMGKPKHMYVPDDIYFEPIEWKDFIGGAPMPTPRIENYRSYRMNWR
jgi:hypothetical protein